MFKNGIHIFILKDINEFKYNKRGASRIWVIN